MVGIRKAYCPPYKLNHLHTSRELPASVSEYAACRRPYWAMPRKAAFVGNSLAFAFLVNRMRRDMLPVGGTINGSAAEAVRTFSK